MKNLTRTLAQALCAAGLVTLQAAAAAPPVMRNPGPSPMPATPMPAPLPPPNRLPPLAREAPVPAWTGPQIPLEAFAAGPQMSEPHISPDGRRLVYLTTVEGQSRVAVRELASQHERVILNAAAGALLVTRCEFKTDDRLLCHLEGVARAGNPPRLYPASRLLAINADGRALRMLFADSVFARLSAAASAQFQDRIVDWLPKDPSHVLIEIGAGGSIFPAVYRLDVYRGDLQLVLAAQPPVMDWTADQTGVVRFGFGFRNDAGVYIARNGPDAPWRTLEEFKRFDHARFDPLTFGA
ncbi:MAG TPA: hypothetical protein VKQ31_07600, partial [Steroidobacteraceae bacterium]|nr:hypothetical protein [Steroidobacteraceae bacterium]